MEDPFLDDWTTVGFTPSPNLKYDRSMLRPKINLIFSRLVERCYPRLKNYAFIRALKGDVCTEYGDYACLSILEVCEELRINDPHLFDKKSPRKIAEDILDGLQDQDFLRLKINGVMINMINQHSIRVHDAGIITFRLDESLIDHRINDMLINGIDTWAPTLYTKRKAKAIFVSHDTEVGEGVTGLLVDCMKDALANIFLYSGIDVLVSPNPHVDVDLQTIQYGVFNYKADVLVYVMPHQKREYIEKGFADARRQKWFLGTTLACCGYRRPEGSLNDLRFDKKEIETLALEFGYDIDDFFLSLLKYTLLKRYRTAEVTFRFEEMIDMEGNTLVNILTTKKRISFIIKDLTSRTSFPRLSKSKKAGKGEHELGLHLVQFTWVIQIACKSLMPHVVCDYMFDLSRLFMSYCPVLPECDKVNLQLCMATHEVIRHCLQLLGLTDYESFYSSRQPTMAILKSPQRVQEIRANDHRFSQSRFELLTMSVFVAHPDFDNGSIFGNIWVRDANLARQGGWTKLDNKDGCYVSYFKHDWHNPLDFYNSSLIPFGDPSGRRSVPISTSLEVDVVLHAMSKNKQHCYLLCHGNKDEPTSKCWDQQPDEVVPDTYCGTLDLRSNVANVQINYILMKNALDASIELLFGSSSNPEHSVKICGYITAYYEDVVKDDDVLGRYKAVIFRTTNFKLSGQQGVLPLAKSLLAVPVKKILKIKAKLDDADSGIEYVRKIWDYRAGEDENWCMNCGNFFINLKVTGSR